MASADMRKELSCAVCLSVYKDPVTLRCGHSFCQGCIQSLLDTQEETGNYSCPECREEFTERPTLHRNVTLNNIVESFQCAEPAQEKTGILCTYCIHSPVAAVKTCQHCECSLCEDHLSVHSKSPEHVLCDPDTIPGTRNCSTHKKILEYYCSRDAACICTSCDLSEEHWGRLEEAINEASEKKKQSFKDVLGEMETKKKNLEERLEKLRTRKSALQEKSGGQSDRVAALFRDMRRRLDDLEKIIANEITHREEQALLSEQILKLELKKEKLSRKMSDIEEMCGTSVALLQDPGTGDLWDAEEEEEGVNDDQSDSSEEVDAECDLDVTRILTTLSTIVDIIIGVNVCFYKKEKTGLTLDENTANNYLNVKEKYVSKSSSDKGRPKTSRRFLDDPQVLSYERFSSGQCYWDVDVRWLDEWSFGMCYPSADRKGNQARIGNNDKSWALYKLNGQLSVVHDRKAIQLSYKQSSKEIRVYLDYEAGLISFYELSDLIRHIYTFTTTFTEPLHAALGLIGKSCGMTVS